MSKTPTTIQFVQVSTEELQSLVSNVLESKLNDFKRNFKPIEPNEYLSRSEVAKMLSVNESTIFNWKKRGILSAFQIGGRVFYKRKDVEDAIVKLKN
jgi:hypothetical protein